MTTTPRIVSGLLFGLLAAPLPALAAPAAGPVTQAAMAQGAKVKSALDSRLAQMNAPASVRAKTADIQKASTTALARAERKGETMELEHDADRTALRAGKASYEAVRIDGAGLASLQGEHGKVAVMDGKIYTETSHAIAPKTTSASFVRQRTLTPEAGKPGQFRVRSHGATFPYGPSKDREYVIDTK